MLVMTDGAANRPGPIRGTCICAGMRVSFNRDYAIMARETKIGIYRLVSTWNHVWFAKGTHVVTCQAPLKIMGRIHLCILSMQTHCQAEESGQGEDQGDLGRLFLLHRQFPAVDVEYGYFVRETYL